jgi:serine/threonine-protein kinase
MFRIANEPHADIRAVSPDIPDCVLVIINKALAKKMEERYQTGQEMAEALRQCAATLH